MLSFFGYINKNYGWELGMFDVHRSLRDGINIFEFKINLDRYKGNHSPRFEMCFTLFNIDFIDFSIYYLHHRDNLLDGSDCY